MRQKGIVFPLVMTLIGTISVLVTMYTLSFVNALKDSMNDQHTEQARALAEGGVDYALLKLRHGDLSLNHTLTLDEGKIQITIRKAGDRYQILSAGEVNYNQKLFQTRIQVMTTSSGNRIIDWRE